MKNRQGKYYYVWVMGLAALFGGLFWLADGIYQYYFFHKNLKFLLLEGPESLLDSIVFNVPPRAIVVRISFIIACLIGGILVAVFLHRQREAQKRLAESEEKYRTLYDSSRDAIMILTPDKGFVSGNPATIKLFGCQKEDEFISLTPADLSPEYQPDGALSAEKAQKMMAIARAQDSHFFEWNHKRVNGREFYASVLLTRMNLYGEEVLQATVRDITERKQAEAELAKYRDHLEEMVRERTAELTRANQQLRQHIAERKRAEDALRERTAELQTMVNVMAGREVRMAELKKVIQKLRAQLEEAGLTPVADDPLKEMAKETADGHE